MYPSDIIISFFRDLNKSKVKYVLLRNKNNELPYNLQLGKDIDLYVPFESRKQLLIFFKNNKFYKIRHPLRKLIRLYGINELEMFTSKAKLLVDINYEFCVKGLSKKHLIPIDKEIQKNLLKNKKTIFIEDVPVNFLGDNEYLVTLIARQVFDKEFFDNWSIQEINRLIKICDHDLLVEYLKLVFFNFTEDLLTLISENQFKKIYSNYLKFNKY